MTIDDLTNLQIRPPFNSTTSFELKVKAVTTLYNKLEIPGLTEKKIDSYFKKGFKELDKLNDSPQKTNLIQFTQDLINRQS